MDATTVPDRRHIRADGWTDGGALGDAEHLPLLVPCSVVGTGRLRVRSVFSFLWSLDRL